MEEETRFAHFIESTMKRNFEDLEKTGSIIQNLCSPFDREVEEEGEIIDVEKEQNIIEAGKKAKEKLLSLGENNRGFLQDTLNHSPAKSNLFRWNDMLDMLYSGQMALKNEVKELKAKTLAPLDDYRKCLSDSPYLRTCVDLVSIAVSSHFDDLEDRVTPKIKVPNGMKVRIRVE